MGLAPYLGFLTRLAERTGRTCIAVQCKHVSMRLTHHVPSAAAVATDLDAFLTASRISSVGILAHSYGTLVASAFLKRRQDAVAGLTLIDPVCFAMYLPHLLRNSIYFHVKRRDTAGIGGSGSIPTRDTPTAIKGNEGSPVARRWRPEFRSLLKGVVVRDVHVAAALCRNGHWADVNLWPTDLPAAHVHTHVVIGARDHLVPVQEVVSLLSTGVAAERGVSVQVCA
jgi:pimeloyl-ACP methyl ester carboxylesterase